MCYTKNYSTSNNKGSMKPHLYCDRNNNKLQFHTLIHFTMTTMHMPSTTNLKGQIWISHSPISFPIPPQGQKSAAPQRWNNRFAPQRHPVRESLWSTLKRRQIVGTNKSMFREREWSGVGGKRKKMKGRLLTGVKLGLFSLAELTESKSFIYLKFEKLCQQTQQTCSTPFLIFPWCIFILFCFVFY